MTQVRASAQALVELAKRRGIAVLLVGHVTKDGAIAGPARARAHGRHGALLRGRARPPVPHPAHRQEPLRRRPTRSAYSRCPTAACGCGRPFGAVPRRAARPCLGRLRVRRHRGHAADADRDPGAGRALRARHAAPCGGRLGIQPAGHGAGRAGGALRLASAPTTSISTSPAACASASRRPISPSPQPWCHRSPTSRCRPTSSCLARSVSRGEVRPVEPARGAAARGGQARLPQRLSAARPRRYRPCTAHGGHHHRRNRASIGSCGAFSAGRPTHETVAP